MSGGRLTRWIRSPDGMSGISLAAIVFAGAAIRLSAIAWGDPFVYHPDEWLVVKSALTMVWTRDWNPHNFFYPMFLTDLEAVVVAAQHLLFGMPLATGQPWLFDSEALPAQFPAFLAGRILVTSMGLATIVVTYAVARRLGGRVSGLLAATVVAVAPLHVLDSRYAVTDVPVTLSCVLALWASVRAWQAPERTGWWVVAAAFVGLAAATKWNAAMVGIVPLLLYLASRPRPPRLTALLRSRTPYLMAGAAALVLIIVTPAIVLAPREVMSYQELQAAIYGQVRWNSQADGLLYQLHAVTFRWPWIGGAWLLSGLLWLVWKGGAVGRAMIVYVALMTVVHAIPPTHFERNLLPVLPFLAIGAAIGMVRAAEWTKGRLVRVGARPARLVAIGAAVILVSASVLPAMSSNLDEARRLRQGDTRTVAREWILDHIPHDAILAREQYTPQLDPAEYRMRNRSWLWQRDLDWYRALGVNYLIVSAANYVRFVGNPLTPAASNFYEQVFQLPEVYAIDPAREWNGYTIRVFRLSDIAGGP